MKDIPINCSNTESRKLLISMFDSLRGWYAVSIKKMRSSATDPQRGYLFGVVYAEMAPYMSELYGSRWTPWDVHCFCHGRFIDEPIIDTNTGTTLGKRWVSTSGFDVAEMAEYIDNCIMFAAEYLDFPVSPPTRGLITPNTAAKPQKEKS